MAETKQFDKKEFYILQKQVEKEISCTYEDALCEVDSVRDREEFVITIADYIEDSFSELQNRNRTTC